MRDWTVATRAIQIGLLLLLPGPASAQTWSLLGPGHANWVEAITVDANGHLYVASDIGGLYKSVDGGNSYFPISVGLTNYHLYEVVVSHDDSNIVFAGGKGGIYKSTDAGMTWNAKRAGIGAPSRYGYRAPIAAIAIDPSSSNILYAGVGIPRGGGWDTTDNQGTVFKSSDAGETWAKVNTGSNNIPADARVYDLVIDPTVTDTLYMASSAGLFQSSDAGVNWVPHGSGLVGTPQFLLMDPQDASVLYATVIGGGVYQSSDAADSWTGFSTGLPMTDPNYDWLSISPSGDDLYVAGNTYSGSTSGVWRRSTSGSSWEKLTQWGDAGNMAHGWYGTQVRVTALAVDPTDANRIYFSGSTTLYKTEDKGASWEQIYTRENAGGFSHRGMNMFGGCEAIAVDPTNPGKLYVDSGDHGLFRSEDHGWTWHQSNEGMRYHQHVFDIVVDPINGDVYASDSEREDSGGGGVAKSTDGGITWTQANVGLPDATVSALAMDLSSAVDSRTLYAGTKNGVYRSTDGGASWSGAGSGIVGGVTQFKPAPEDPSIMWAVTNAGVYRTSNGGSSWSQVNQDELRNVTDIDIDPSNGDVVYISTSRMYDSGQGITYDAGVYKSMDGGRTWESKLHDPEWISAIELDYDNPNVIYATSMTNNYYDEASGTGMFRSTDAGETWEEVHNNMPVLRYEELLIDPTDSAVVYVGAVGSGYYVNRVGIEACSSLGGECCGVGEACEGGSFEESSDCEMLCCVGGSCQASGTGGGGAGAGGGVSAGAGEVGPGSSDQGCGCRQGGRGGQFSGWLAAGMLGVCLRRGRRDSRRLG